MPVNLFSVTIHFLSRHPYKPVIALSCVMSTRIQFELDPRNEYYTACRVFFMFRISFRNEIQSWKQKKTAGEVIIFVPALFFQSKNSVTFTFMSCQHQMPDLGRRVYLSHMASKAWQGAGKE